MNNKYSPQIQDNDTINIRAELEKYLFHWKWFALGILLALIGAFLFLRYATPKYSASTTILIKNDKQGGLSEELAAFEDLGIVGGSSKNIDNEIEILKSRKLIKGVVHKLNLNTSLIVEGRVKESEVYFKKPIAFQFKEIDSLNFNKIDTIINIEITSSDHFKLFDINENLISENSFNQNISSVTLGEFAINKTEHFDENEISKKYKLKITPINKIVDSYLKDISVNPINKKSSVIKLSLQSPLKEKAEDILDELVYQYNLDAIKDKKEVSIKTNDFIIERLANVGKELSQVDSKVESFKSSNNITDIEPNTTD